MSESVTKKAYARGIGEFLQRAGAIQVPTAVLLKEACDRASELISVEPAFHAVSPDDSVKVAQALVHFSDQLVQNGKVASDGRVEYLGHSEATAVGDMIQKVAREVLSAYENNPANTSSTVTGERSDQTNLLSDSQNAEAKLDKDRPEGYANVGQGNTNFSEAQAARIGTEETHPNAPKPVGGAASNSVVQSSKAASILHSLSKLAEGDAGYKAPASPAHGSTIVGGDPDQQNLLSDSYNGEAMMEVSERPENYATVGQGNAGIGDVSPASEIGTEENHPKAPAAVGGAASNSVTEASTKGASARWHRHFQEVAAEVMPYLPPQMPVQQKTAAVKECMKLEPHEQARLLTKIAEAYKTPPQNTVGNILDSIGMVAQG